MQTTDEYILTCHVDTAREVAHAVPSPEKAPSLNMYMLNVGSADEQAEVLGIDVADVKEWLAPGFYGLIEDTDDDAVVPITWCRFQDALEAQRWWLLAAQQEINLVDTPEEN